MDSSNNDQVVGAFGAEANVPGVTDTERTESIISLKRARSDTVDNNNGIGPDPRPLKKQCVSNSNSNHNIGLETESNISLPMNADDGQIAMNIPEAQQPKKVTMSSVSGSDLSGQDGLSSQVQDSWKNLTQSGEDFQFPGFEDFDLDFGKSDKKTKEKKGKKKRKKKKFV